MKPEDVNPHNFKQKTILYSKDGFSIAFGTWMEDGEPLHECLAMRWDDSPEEPGYPKAFGNPMWFAIPQELTAFFTKSIMLKKEIDAELMTSVVITHN